MDEKANEAGEATEPLQDQRSSIKELDNIEAVFNHAGAVGRYSIMVLLYAILVNVFTGMVTLSANFTAANMAFNCSEFENMTSNTCELDGRMEVDDVNSQCGMTFNCSVPLYEASESRLVEVRCVKFQFFDEIFQETAVSKFNLVCDRAWMAKLATTFYFVGFLVGCSLYGAIADRFGRLKAIAISLVQMSACVVGASQAPFLWLYWTLQLLSGIGIGGFLSCTFSYTLENTDDNNRSVWGFTLNNGWTIGTFVGTFIAYFVPDYQLLLLIYGLSALVAAPPLFLLSESPRWLVSSGQYRRADTALQRIAGLNKRPLNESFSTEAIIHNKRSSVREDKNDGCFFILNLVRRPGLRRITVIVWIMFFSASMAFYGISLSIGDLGGSIFINQLIVSAVEVPARLLGALAGYRINRRISIMVAFSLAGACLTATAFLVGQSHLATARIACAMTGKLLITLSFGLAWLYSAEVFPTVIRSLGVGSGSTSARAGAMVSTLIPGLGVFWQPLPYLVFAVGPLAVLLLTLLLPETRGRRLPNTLDEGEALVFGHRQANSENAERKEDDQNADVEFA